MTDTPANIQEPKNTMPSLLRCLSVVLALKGSPASDAFLMAELGGGRITLQSCLTACRRAGLEGELTERKIADIPDPVLPCILFLKERACVLVQKDSDMVKVIYPDDPHAIHTITMGELASAYSGRAVFCKVDTRIEERARSIIPEGKGKWFWSVIRQYGSIYRNVAVLSFIMNLAALASPFFVMNVYDRVVPNNAVETLWTLSIGVAIIYIFNWFFTEFRTYLVDTAAQKSDLILQSRLLEKTISMQMEHKPDSTGALVNNIREFEQVRELFSSGSLVALIDLPFMAIFLGIIVFIAGPLVFIPMVALPLLLLIGWNLQRKSREAATSAFKSSMHKSALLVEIVSGLEVIKTCQAERRMLRLWEAVSGLSGKNQFVTRKYTARATAISNFAVQVVTLIAIIWGCYLISAGEMTLGALIAVNILLGRIMAPIIKMTALLSRYQTSRVAFEVLDKIMQIPSENTDSKSGAGLLPVSFEFDHVTFAYPGCNAPQLRDLSLCIGQGERVGIIGPIGSGKSTILRLLLGLYAPTEGVVRFGGVNLRQLAVSDLRSRIGVCPQEATLFYGTIKDNITLGDVTITDQILQRACAMAGVMDFLRHTPDGFAMQVGEQGKALSGGERQAVALARALVRNPEILILDEPTSNMDAESEMRVQENLGRILKGRTLVVVTHRMSMLAIVERLIVMKNGEIFMDGEKNQVIRELQAHKAAVAA